MEPAEKERIDKRIEKISKQRIDNLAIKLLPSVKKKERERLQARHGKNESVDLNEMWGAYVTKRPHMLMDKNNKPKFDKRFKMFKPKQVTEMNEFDIEDIVELMESVEKFTETTGKYYTGVAKNKKDDREDHFERNAKKADDDPSAYRPAPGDKEAKTKESKHTKKARAMGYTEEFDFLGEDAAGKSLADKAKKSGMPAGILRKVYNRGVAAWKTGHRPGTTPEQWGHARVNSFITKSSGTWGKADSDLAAKVRKEEVELDEAPRRKGAPKMTGDSIAIQRAKDAEHAKAMGRSVKTGRKLPKKTMTSTQRSLASLRGEGNEQMPKTYKNIIEAATPQMKKAAASIEAYAKKSGGIDKADFMKAAKMLSSGNAGSNFVKFVMYLDTEPREWLIMDLAKTMGKQTVEKMFKVKIRESVNEATAAKPKNNKAERERRLAQNMKKLKDMRKSDKSWGKSSAFDYHEEVELDETLSPSEKKLVNQMYDKKGNLTAIGKKVMNHGKKPGDKGYVESLDDRFEAFMAESIDEVLDTPKAMDSYRNKAKYSKDKAVNSALATALRGDGDGKKDLKTMSKRAKGLKMADRNATNKTVKALRAGYSEDLDEDAKMKKQSDDNLKSLHKQFKGQDQKMPSTQHMMKRITKEMKRRNMSESEEAAKLASVANGGVQDKEEKFKNALSRVRNKKSMKDESSCGSSKKRNEEAGAGEEGTAKLVKRLKKDTPNA
jgi:hypothetical protein